MLFAFNHHHSWAHAFLTHVSITLFASCHGHLQIAVLDTLAQLGCDPSVKDSVSSTPMHVAAGEGHIEAILKLVALVRAITQSFFGSELCRCTASLRLTRRMHAVAYVLQPSCSACMHSLETIP